MSDKDKTPEEPVPTPNQELKRPKMKKKPAKADRTGSKTAPAFTEEEEDHQETPTEPPQSSEDPYYASYNYYLFYHAQNPKNPRLPIPSFKPTFDIDFIKGKKNDTNDEKKSPDINYILEGIKEDEEHSEIPGFQNEFGGQQGESNNLNNNFQPFNNKFKNKELEYYNNPNNEEEEFENQEKNTGFRNNPNINPQMNMGNINDIPNINYQNMNVPPFMMNYGYQQNMMNMNNNMNMNNLNMNNNNMNMNSMNNMNNNLSNLNNNLTNSPQNMNMPNMNMQNMNVGFPDIRENPQNRPKKKPTRYKNPSHMDQMSVQNPVMYNAYYGPNQNLMMNSYNMPNMNYEAMPMFNMMGGMGPMGMNMNYMEYDPKMNGKNYMNPNNFKKNYKKNNQNNLNNKKEVNDITQEELIQKANELAKTHAGSRKVQDAYGKGSTEIRNKIFEKFKEEILILSKDSFGNFAIQKVLDTNDSEKMDVIFNQLKGKFYELTLHQYGCRVVQKLIEVIDKSYLPSITEELKDHFAKCIEDQNGNHVVQKLIDRLDIGEDNGVFQVVLDNLENLAKHQYGCRVIQKLYEKCDDQQKKKLLDVIYKNIPILCEDQFGNYMIQFILDKEPIANLTPIFTSLRGKVYAMSMDKFASNVVEKALSLGTNEQREIIVQEILKKDDEDSGALLRMVEHRFGNYVVQMMIKHSDERVKNNIIARINNNESSKKEGFSKHVINFIQKNGYSTEKMKDAYQQIQNEH